jgi:D-threo-aldose 1-dehydrogenase
MTVPLPTALVGRAGLSVTKIGLGTAPLGGWLGRVDADMQAIDTVRFALEHGVGLIDTAPMYGAGRSERLIGQAVQGVERSSYVLATKVGRMVMPDGSVGFDFTRDGVLRCIDDSLRRLQLDRIDILHIHDADDHNREALEEIYPLLADLRSQGVIRAIGAGMNQWEMELEFARSAAFDCFLLAGRYTLLEQESAREFLPYCHEHGIAVFLGGVFNSGILATGAAGAGTYNYAPPPPDIIERVKRLEQVCARYGVALHVAAIHFPLAHPAVSSLVLGARSPAEVQAALDALHTPMPGALWEELRAEQLIAEHAPVPT